MNPHTFNSRARHSAAGPALAALVLAGLVLGSAITPVAAQTFPGKTVVILLPYGAGGSADATIRPIASRLSKMWGQPVIVENKVGANGIIATQALIKAAPDGHTILYHLTGMVQNPLLYKTAGYDPLKDVTPVVQLGGQAMGLSVAAGSPLRSMDQLLGDAQKKTGGHSYGSVGVGHTGHIWSELLTTERGIKATNIVYRSAPGMLVDLASSRIDWAFLSSADAVSRSNDKMVRVLAVTGTERLKGLPEVPTMKELGLPGFEMVGWHGLFVPAGTAPDIVRKIDADVRSVLAEPQIAKVAEDQAIQVTATGSAGFRQIVKNDYERWGAMIRKFNIQPQ